MGICLIKMSDGFIQSQLWGERQLKYDTIVGNRTPYVYGDEIQPFRITLQLSPLDGEFTSEFKDKITRWLNNGKFNKFYSYDDEDRIYYLTYIGSPSKNVTGTNQGYVEIEFQNIDCYVRSNVEERSFDLSTSTSPTVIELSNLGTETILPDVYIQKATENGSVTLRNLSNGGMTSSLSNLFIDEEVYLDGENRTVVSTNPNIYRYDDFNKVYINLLYGVNRIEISGKCKVKFQFRHLFLSN